MSDILPANSESQEQRQERRCLELHAVIDSVSAARLRRAPRARTRKYIAWQPGERFFWWREGRGTVKLPGLRGAWCGTSTILVQERRRVGNVESMTGVVWLVHGKVLLRATPEQLRPATSAERVLGELQNTNLDEFTQVVNNLPKGVAVDLTGQVGPTEENIDDDTILVGPPEETEPSGEAEDLSEHDSDEVEPETVSHQDPSAPASDQELRLTVVPVVDPELHESKTDHTQSPVHDPDLESPMKIDAYTSQDQTQFDKAS